MLSVVIRRSVSKGKPVEKTPSTKVKFPSKCTRENRNSQNILENTKITTGRSES